MPHFLIDYLFKKITKTNQQAIQLCVCVCVCKSMRNCFSGHVLSTPPSHVLSTPSHVLSTPTFLIDYGSATSVIANETCNLTCFSRPRKKETSCIKSKEAKARLHTCAMMIKVFVFPVNETMHAVNSCQEKYRYWTAPWAYYDFCDKDSFITLRGTSVIRACVV